MRLPNRWLVLALALAASAGVLATYHTLLGRDSGVALLLILLSLKLLELREIRDAFIAIFLGFFLVVANFLYTQSIAMGVYMLIVVWIFCAALLGFNRIVARPSLLDRLGLAALLLLQAVPLMLVLFVLFPRLPGPLWGLPKDAHAGLSGLSDNMTPGSIANLSLSDAIAFRASFDGAIPQPASLYWRGPVLSDFDGKTWRARTTFTEQAVLPRPNGEQLRYTVTLEPHGKPWLFVLDVPLVIPSESRLTPELQVVAPANVTARRRYTAASVLADHTSGASGDLARYLALPPSGNSRSRALAAEWRAKSSATNDLVDRARRLFREQTFFYTLRAPLLLPHDSIDDFLFHVRNGFCEHYAGSFVFLMRAAGVPARVVTGYLGGEINFVGGYLVVRQADAHAWAEVWFQDKGWVRVDPTSFIAPERVDRGIEATLAPEGMPAFLAREEFSWLKHLRFSWDAFNNSWNQWVLGYGQERQRYLLSRLGMPQATWQQLSMTLMGAAALVGLALAAFVLRHYRIQRADPVVRAYQRYCRKLARKGIERLPQEGPLDFAARVSRLKPSLAGAAREITDAYVALRYANLPSTANAKKLANLVQQFRVA